MKTINKIFMYIMLALSLTCVGAVIYGATHHWATALMCFVMFVLIKEDLKRIEKREKAATKKPCSGEIEYVEWDIKAQGAGDLAKQVKKLSKQLPADSNIRICVYGTASK